MIDASPFLAIALLLPVIMAAVSMLPTMRRGALDLLPFAPIPALLGALLVPDGGAQVAPDLLLGLTIGFEGQSRVFVGFAALIWLLAGIYARTEMQGTERPSLFAFSWCLALAGNLGVFLSADVVTFYASFACMTFAAYPAIVASGSEAARKAGRVYIVFSVVGETALIAGLMLATVGAPSILIADVSASVLEGPGGHGALVLLLVGFGIKAGLVPLHLWLPLAHPAAPPAASAVLSGAMVKAGLFGMMQFFPVNGALPVWPDLLFVFGMVGAFYGVAVGLAQNAPKTILAYSTVSQMSLMVALVSAGIGSGAAESVFAGVALYALHHALAKGALFMGAGLAAKAPQAQRGVVALLLLMPAFSIAGLALTGGSLAKLAGKMPFEGFAELLVTLSATGTMLLMIRFLLAALGTRAEDTAPLGLSLIVPTALAGAAGLVAPWAIFVPLAGREIGYVLEPANLWSASWPLLLALGLVMLWRKRPMRVPDIPPGDVLAPLGAALLAIGTMLARVHAPQPPAARIRRHVVVGLSRLQQLESGLLRWSAAGPVLVGMVLLAALVLGF